MEQEEKVKGIVKDLEKAGGSGDIIQKLFTKLCICLFKPTIN